MTKRGEIWLAALDPTAGAEIGKTRPVVMIGSDTVGVLPLRVVVPLTSWQDRYSAFVWMVKLIPDQENGLSNVSAADAFQIRSISASRLIRCFGCVSAGKLREIVTAVYLCVP